MQFPKTTSHISYSVAAEKHTCLPRRPVVSYVYFLHRCFDPSLRTNQETPCRRKATNKRLLTRISSGPNVGNGCDLRKIWPLQCWWTAIIQMHFNPEGSAGHHLPRWLWADKSQLNIPFFQTNFHQKKEVNNTSIHPTTLRPIDPLLNFSQASVPLLHLPGPLPELLPHVVDRDQMESTCVESGFVILLGHLSPELVWPVPLARLAVLLTIRGVKMAKGQLCNVYKEHM